MTDSLLHALGMAFAMGWEILWPLILGFALSAAVQALVSHRELVVGRSESVPRRASSGGLMAYDAATQKSPQKDPMIRLVSRQAGYQILFIGACALQPRSS